MENKNAQPGNPENPKEEPDDGKSRLESDPTLDNTGQESAPPIPDGETVPLPDSQKDVIDASPVVQEEPSEPKTPLANIQGLAEDDSMDALGTEAQNGSSPLESEQSAKQADDLRAEPDIIDELRRSLKEIEPPEKPPGLIPRLTNWWKRSFSTARGKTADDASLDARLDNDLQSFQPKSAADLPDNEENQVENLFGELEHLAATEGVLPITDKRVEVPTPVDIAAQPISEQPVREPEPLVEKAAESVSEQTLGETETPVEKAAEPVSEQPVSGSESQSQSVESPHDVERTNYELTEVSQGNQKPYSNYQDLRDTALEDFEDAPVAQTIEGHRTLGDLARRTFSELKTSEKRLLVGACIVILGIGLFLGAYLFTATRTQKAAPTPTIFLGPSYPVEITLPAGWDFPLAIGKLINNRWSPGGAEWLEGTEISRWVSLPWSAQLEAVVKTLKPNDTLVLIMSNTDHLEYKVQSVKQQNVDSFAGVDKTVQGLVVFLTNDNSRQTWVIRAVPQ